jgi:hypothetical protein
MEDTCDRKDCTEPVFKECGLCNKHCKELIKDTLETEDPNY